MARYRGELFPRWARPIRIPEAIPIEHSEPEVALAGEKSTWRLRFRLVHDVAPGSVLHVQVFGGRNNKGAFEGLQADTPEEDGYVTASIQGGNSLAIRRGHGDGTFQIQAPRSGLRAGAVLCVVLGDRSGGGGGAVAPSIRLLNKFFVLYGDPAARDAASASDLPQWAVSGAQAEADVGSVWSESNQHLMLAACTMHVLGGKIDHLRAYVPSQTTPGVPFHVLIRPEDQFSNLSCETLGDVAVFADGEQMPAAREPVPESTCLRVRVALGRDAVCRLKVRDLRSGEEATANPTICGQSQRRLKAYWGMIHGHTEMSDGAGTLEYYFRQMRDEAGLDFAAPGDHDHLWETSDAMWKHTCETVAMWNEPGRFVTFPGYEWAKWRRNGDGDRNVYYLRDHRPMYRSDDGCFPTPPDLFRAIHDEKAIVIPHHTGHGGNWCDWKDHDPEHERLVEIYQIRGSYESSREDGNPVPEAGVGPPVPEGFVSRALAMGWRVGFTAGGDDHCGHSGTDFPLIRPGGTSYKAGLMCAWARELTREAIWEALWNRRVVATTGPRIILQYQLNGHPMGSELSAAAHEELRSCRVIRIEAHGTAPVERIDVIRNNSVIYRVSGGAPDCEASWEDTRPLDEVLLPPAKFCRRPFCFYYLRLIQADGEVAWASPIWIDLPEQDRIRRASHARAAAPTS